MRSRGCGASRPRPPAPTRPSTRRPSHRAADTPPLHGAGLGTGATSSSSPQHPLEWILPHLRVGGVVEIERSHQGPARADRRSRLLRQIRHEAFAQVHERAHLGDHRVVSGALGDVPGRAVARRETVVVELGVVLHDRLRRRWPTSPARTARGPGCRLRTRRCPSPSRGCRWRRPRARRTSTSGRPPWWSSRRRPRTRRAPGTRETGTAECHRRLSG